MAKKSTLTASYDELSWIVRLLIVIIGGVIVGGIYRIVRYFESGKLSTLVVGLLATFTGIGNVIIWVVDVVTTIMHGKFTVMVE